MLFLSGLVIYGPGSFAVWLLTASFDSFRHGLIAGSWTALIGLVCVLIGSLLDGTHFALAISNFIVFASLPAAILSGFNGGAGDAFLVFFLALVGGSAFRFMTSRAAGSSSP